MLGASEHRALVVFSQGGFEAVDATQVQLAASDHLEQHGNASRGAAWAQAFALEQGRRPRGLRNTEVTANAATS